MKELKLKQARKMEYGTCTVYRAKVIIKDEHGIPNFMTLFYMNPNCGTPDEKDIPDMFKVNGKIVAGIAISQFHNTSVNGVPQSLPYCRPWDFASYQTAEEACRKKGKGWHLLTNTEFVYLLNEADKLGRTIHGNTNCGACADAPEERGVLYDNYCTLTGLDPDAWSHDGTKDGVFGLCGNFWEPVAGLRLRKGTIEYVLENDAADADLSLKSKAWKVAEANGKELKLSAKEDGGVILTTGETENAWESCHYSELGNDGMEEIPEILYKLGIVPKNYETEKAGIWVDSSLPESLPLRGSSFFSTGIGGSAALLLYGPRSNSYGSISFRSALILENWKQVTDALTGA